MIIHRYITKEIATVFFSILTILTIALLSQQFVRYLNFVALGKAPANAVFSLVGFEIPYLLVFLLPFSIYISMLWVFSRLQLDYEMIILEMSGFGIKKLTSLTLMLGAFVALLVFVLLSWINPVVSVKRQLVLADDNNTARLIQTLIPGRFHITNDDRVIYVETLSRDRTEVGNIFMADLKRYDTQIEKNRWHIVVAKEGVQTDASGNQDSFFVLRDGYRYEGIPGQNDYRILKFNKYAMVVPENNLKLSHHNQEFLTLAELFHQLPNKKSLAELEWRLSMPLFTLILCLFSLSLSFSSPRSGKYKRFIPAMIIFILYVNLLLLSKKWIEEGTIPFQVGFWWVHLLFLTFALLLLKKYYYRRT